MMKLNKPTEVEFFLSVTECCCLLTLDKINSVPVELTQLLTVQGNKRGKLKFDLIQSRNFR